MVSQFEERAKELMMKYFKLLYQFLPLNKIPKVDFLIYSLEENLFNFT